MNANGTQKRTRQQRVAAVELAPGLWRTLWANLQRGGVLLRMGLAAAAALFLWAFTQSWDPPFQYHENEIPQRDLVARTDFEQPDPKATEEAKERARKLAIAVFHQDPEPLEQLRAQLIGEITKLLATKTWDEVDSNLWAQFQPQQAAGTPDPTDEERAEQFQRFQEAFSEDGAIDKFSEQLAGVMAPLEQWGLLEPLPSEWGANFEKIEIRSKTSESFGAQRAVSEVLVENAAAKLQLSLKEKIGSLELAQKVFAWLRPRLAPTLVQDLDATHAAQDAMAAAEPEKTKPFRSGVDVLAPAGKPLTDEAIELLRLEYVQQRNDRTFPQRLRRSVSILGMFVALYTLCGTYIYTREPKLLHELLRLVALLSLVVLVVVFAHIINQYNPGVDVIPLLLCGMTLAIAYNQELSLLISACVALIIVLTNGHDFPQALVLMATTAGAILVLKQVRTRSKLLTVGFTAAAVGFLTTLGVGTLYGRPWPLLLEEGGLLAVWSIIAGALMTVLLPTVEKVFNVQTDLSLFELGDPAHPLLQELIRRAPGTYNHSITVASLAENAAEAIGARGLLVRVGAYYHDIGKMLKPGYFIENQGQGDNRHDALMPAMSTLVIIAHVKDGADLARQNKIPEAIIDFIQEHHGTTLVEYFYRQASEQREKEDPDGGEVDESSFRYPGPRPQTREAGVLMLSDAVESASRVLKEPTPSRIESLVEDLSMKRLLDGQFDESGLTLEEVHKIGESLVKSLTAKYHGRVKYPDQVIA
ncbi:HD family phosphohydrolase [Adhaeretor mobilis]|uniref:HD/PDEase domain-containing protein n=1 Tax=Adhaeretor mobilis TaxID=1930276 RepID=A0A517MSK1_9BACT|nr:HDIG domain-containing metalloprotein [Adhaeretor mobilis]QDS97851.1 hypothetical protein HG15A2_11190 [Adhaeretor mobilis]